MSKAKRKGPIITVEVQPSAKGSTVAVLSGRDVIHTADGPLESPKFRKTFLRSLREKCPALPRKVIKEELAKKLRSESQSDLPAPTGKRVVSQLIDFAREVPLFRAQGDAGAGFATIPIESRHQSVPLRNQLFTAWLNRRFKQRFGEYAPQTSLKEAIQSVTQLVLLEGKEWPVRSRVGGTLDQINLDLCDDDGRMVVIDRDGWRVTRDPPKDFRFVRTQGMLPLPVPVKGGDTRELETILNISGRGLTLTVAWLLGALMPRGPYPILALNGEQGSAKSTASRFIRSLIDPHAVTMSRPPQNERDLWVTVAGKHVAAFDNLSGLRPDIADGLCSLSTGATWEVRLLYSDGETFAINKSCPIILNGIDDLLNRPDLAERTLHVILPPIATGSRRPEADLTVEFEGMRPRVLGALLDAASCALRNRQSARGDALPRMADFARFVTAAEEALRWKRGRFLRAMKTNQRAKSQQSVDSSLVAQAIVEMVRRKGEWTGTTSDLMKELRGALGTLPGPDGAILGSPVRLGKFMRRMAPDLKAVGVERVGCRSSSSDRERRQTLKWASWNQSADGGSRS